MKIDISVDIDELIKNILNNEELFEFMIEELTKRNDKINIKDVISMDDLLISNDKHFDHINDMIVEPDLSIVVAPIKRRRGRPKKRVESK
jgi:hypothetical protein